MVWGSLEPSSDSRLLLETSYSIELESGSFLLLDDAGDRWTIEAPATTSSWAVQQPTPVNTWTKEP